jgi:hypothetical protein
MQMEMSTQHITKIVFKKLQNNEEGGEFSYDIFDTV